MREKKGTQFTTEKAIGLIFAVLVIIILLYVGYKVAQIFIGNYTNEQAKKIVEEIEMAINRVNVEESSFVEVLIFNPREWFLFWAKGDFCVLESEKQFELAKNTIDGFSPLQKEGFCKNFGSKIVFKLSLEEGKEPISLELFELEKKQLPLTAKIGKSDNKEKIEVVFYSKR
jgi:hypothetical protein